MIINNKNKYIFVATPKTASTSIQKFLMEKDKKIDKNHIYLQEQYHWPIKYILMENPDKHNYFKFGFSRNPWDRMISSWIEFTTDNSHLVTWSKGLKEEFTNFENFILNLKDSKWSEDIHFKPSAWYLFDEFYKNQLVDYIGKYETLDESFNFITNKIGYNSTKMSNQKKWRKSSRKVDYKEYYTNNKMIESVSFLFESDISKLGYNY